MNIDIITLSEKGYFANGERGIFVVEVDGDPIIEIREGEPEDATLDRDYNDLFNITDILLKVYDAGRRSEPLHIINKEVPLY